MQKLLKMEMEIINKCEYFDSNDCVWVDLTAMFAGSPLTKLRRLRYEIANKKIKDGTKIRPQLPPCSGNIFLTKNAFDDMDMAAKNMGRESIINAYFDIMVTCKPKGDLPLRTDVLKRISIKSINRYGDIWRLYFETI